MKLIDVFPDALTGSGIFDALNTYNVPWKTDISSISLDLEYFGNVSGDKTVSPLIRKLSVNGVLSPSAIAKIAQSLYNMHGLRWTKLWNTYQLEYDPIQNYNMTEIMSDDDTVTTYGRTHSKTGTEVDDRTRTDDNKDSVYGFNSSTASDSDESDRTINDDNTHTYNVSDTDTGSDRQSHSYELTRSGNIGVTTSQQMIESERALWMWRYFYDVVFPDVDKMLTISIYSDDAVIVETGSVTPTGTIYITSNGDYDVAAYADASVDVPNTYTELDNGMVVYNGELVSQIGREISENGTYDTTLNNAVMVNVPNTYTESDNGKVVNNGALVSQGSLVITSNGSYDTTLYNDIEVNIPIGYLVPAIPVMTSNTTPSGVASASSVVSSLFDAFKAFDGTDTSSNMQGGWLASSGDNSPWLKYEFENAVRCSSIKIWTSNNGPSAVKNVRIEGLTDNVWENALETGQTVSLSFTQNTYGNTSVLHEIYLNNNIYDAIRISCDESFYYGVNSTACTFAEVQVYTPRIIS